MKVLVTGAKGQLGHDVIKRLNEAGLEAIGSGREDFDLTKGEEVSDYLNKIKPDAVIHCAAYTAVDKAESDRECCYIVNALGAENIARACREIKAKLLYVSTDYVFDGKGENAFEIYDTPNPINYYGHSKYIGEQMIREYLQSYFIVRTSWVFGTNGNNFIKTMLKLEKEKNELNVVSDQIGSPTFSADLAKLIVEMIKTNKYGVYHATNEGFCSWYDFACAIFRMTKCDVKVNPVTSEQYVTAAKRPKNSRLSKKALEENGLEKLPPWEDALRRYLNELKHESM